MIPSWRIFIAAIAMAFASNMLVGCNGCEEKDQQKSGPKAVLFNIDGEMPSFPGTSILSAGQLSQYKLEKLLDKASKDLQVQEIVVHFGSVQLSFARAMEIGDAIDRVSQSGKKVTCHIDSADNLTYLSAVRGCPRILVSPAGGIEAVGLSLEAVYLRDLLSTVGVTADMIHIGKYKDAAEPLMASEMSPETRESSTALVNELHRLMVQNISKKRKIAPDKVQQLIDSAPHNAHDSVKIGLVDEVLPLGTLLDSLQDKYEYGVTDEYGKTPPKPLSLVDIANLIKGAGDEETKTPSARVAIIPAIGSISSGGRDDIFSGADTIRDQKLIATLSKAAHDDSIKAVVLRIDSPGGSALASDNIWHAVRALAEKKPVVASLGDVAASGGYYIASGATEIMASPATLTGSIGVVGGKIVIGEVATKLGINTERITTAKNAALISPFTPFTDEERQTITKHMTDAYNMFIDRVATGRGMDKSKVQKVAEGRVWTGSQALSSGLVDNSGSLAQAVDRALKLASLPAGTPVEIFPKKKNFLEMLTDTLTGTQSGTSVEMLMARRHAAIRHAMSVASLLLDNRVLAVASTSFEIH